MYKIASGAVGPGHGATEGRLKQVVQFNRMCLFKYYADRPDLWSNSAVVADANIDLRAARPSKFLAVGSDKPEVTVMGTACVKHGGVAA